MMKKLTVTLGCLLLMAGLSFGAVSFSFNDNGLGAGAADSGTYTPGSSFNFDILLTFTSPPANVVGDSFWFELAPANSTFLTITGRTFTTTTGSPTTSPFNDDNATFAPQGFTIAQSNGNLANPQDLGGTAPTTGLPPNQVLVETPPGSNISIANVSFMINPSTPAGTYTLLLATANTRRSQVTEQSGTTMDPIYTAFAVPLVTYTFTVVPEPPVWSLIGLGGIGSMGLTWLRARRRR